MRIARIVDIVFGDPVFQSRGEYSGIIKNQDNPLHIVMNLNFEPRILAFCCNWCAYAGADLAGVSRLQMPPNFRVIRVMCSGRVDPLFILKALETGADGVLVMGCHPGDCHYIAGNLKAERRMKFLKDILAQMGLAERIHLEWVGASEGEKFQNVIKEFTTKIREAGPSPLKPRFHFRRAVKDNQKRDQLRELLLSIANQVGYTPTEVIKLPEEDVMEGFGFPVVDAKKCMGCGACSLHCPERVLQMIDSDGVRSLIHYEYNCRTCRRCEEICPNDAIEIKSGFDIASFLSGEATKDVDLDLVKCRICGNFFSTSAQLDDIRTRISAGDVERGNGGLEFPGELLEVCPECRRKLEARRIKQYSIKEVMEVTEIPQA